MISAREAVRYPEGRCPRGQAENWEPLAFFFFFFSFLFSLFPSQATSNGKRKREAKIIIIINKKNKNKRTHTSRESRDGECTSDRPTMGSNGWPGPDVGHAVRDSQLPPSCQIQGQRGGNQDRLEGWDREVGGFGGHYRMSAWGAGGGELNTNPTAHSFDRSRPAPRTPMGNGPQGRVSLEPEDQRQRDALQAAV